MVDPKILLAGCVVAALCTPAMAGREPFGLPFDGWEFTQEDAKPGVLCRAQYRKTFAIGMKTDGSGAVSVPAAGIPDGTYTDTTIEVNGLVEMVSGQSNKGRFWSFDLYEGLVEEIGRARGYLWRIALPDGRLVEVPVRFNNSAPAAIERVRECIMVNGG